MDPLTTGFSCNIKRFSDFADLYDRFRPGLPAALGDVLSRLARITRLELVVDLGSGTGLSTRYWAGRAVRVVGIEPTADMRRQAEAQTVAANVTYRDGFSHQMGLPDRCAQIVACSQSLYWMEPQATFVEAARVLLPGGIFAALDYDWPPATGAWEADAAYEAYISRVRDCVKSFQNPAPPRQWDKASHLVCMSRSGYPLKP